MPIIFILSLIFSVTVPPLFIEYLLEKMFVAWIGVKPCWFLVQNPDDHPTTVFCFGLALVFYLLTYMGFVKLQKKSYGDELVENDKYRKYALIFFGGISALDLLQATIRACWIACFS